MADESAREVELESFPLAMVIIMMIFLVFGVFSVGVRTYVRLSDKVFGLDDGLMLAGLVVYISDTALAVRGVSVGIGSKNDRLNTWLQAEAEKFYIAWITIYVIGVALIKSSVCTTLIRIAAEAHRFMRIAVWALLGLTWASFCVTFFGILTFCRPVEANWNTALVAEGKASCADTETLIGISHTNTGTSIATDVGCIVLPGLLLWNAQMRTKDKLRVFGLLSVASVASLTTIARAPFISRYKEPTDNLMYYIGYVVLLSSVETGIGCIAASLPSTRVFYLRVRGLDSSKPASTPNAKSLVTIGGGIVDGNRSVPNRKVFTKSTDRSTTTACVVGGAGDWERLHDDDSDKGILLNGKNRGIRADYSYAVELEPVKTSRSERSD